MSFLYFLLIPAVLSIWVQKPQCDVGGCYGMMCMNAPMKAPHACEATSYSQCFQLTNAACGIDFDGNCRWFSTPEFIQCLVDNNAPELLIRVGLSGNKDVTGMTDIDPSTISTFTEASESHNHVH